MRPNVRSFVREYKSRSFKATLQSLKDYSASGQEAQQERLHEKRSMADLVIATRRNDEVQKEAEAAFRQGEATPPLHGFEGEAPSTGRILPCLLQEPISPASEHEGKANSTRRSKGRASSTKKRVKPRLQPSRETHPPLGSRHPQSTLWSPSVSDEFVKLSDLEILSLVERAKTELVRRKDASKEKLRAEIEAKLTKAGLELGDLFESEGKRTRGPNKANASAVAAKYKNHITGETWSGRGRSPKWVATILQEREWTVEEFKQSDEFLIP